LLRRNPAATSGHYQPSRQVGWLEPGVFQITGEPMKFLTPADWTGMVETELYAQTYKSYGLATVR
jgi:hypothetical protein